jgi:hypothetical protein
MKKSTARSRSSKSQVIRTAGTWDPQEWPIYFAATVSGVYELTMDKLDNMLIAVNEIANDRGSRLLEQMLGIVHNVLIDSGVYWLSTQHARAHDVSMDVALSMAPIEIDNFEWLFDSYVDIVRKHGDRAWGYIEIDQGGRENKLKTRAKLERLGLRPIPVYHPFNDGWEYFDYLAERYDRICFGNVVMADFSTRKRLLATAWERRRKYPHLWIHMLGLTPGDLLTAFPINSCDSSSWMTNPRWGHHRGYIGAQRVGADIRGFMYDMDTEKDDAGGSTAATHLAAYDVHMLNRSINLITNEQRRDLGADPGLFE